MTGLDSSIVVRLLAGEPIDQAERARRLLDDLAILGEKPAISDLVVSEVYFALQYHYEVPKPKALAALKDLFDSGDVIALGAAPDVLRIEGLATAKPGFVDRLIHQGYDCLDYEMATFEKKSAKLKNARII